MNIEKIQEHYAHVREMHPYFCDYLVPCDVGIDRQMVEDELKDNLAESRERVKYGIETKRIGWDVLLNCEVWEALEAMFSGDKDHAVEELYEAIAVCLRTIDVLEGRQKLGKPTKGEAK